jgi:hypothetical protein
MSRFPAQHPRNECHERIYGWKMYTFLRVGRMDRKSSDLPGKARGFVRFCLTKAMPDIQYQDCPLSGISVPSNNLNDLYINSMYTCADRSRASEVSNFFSRLGRYLSNNPDENCSLQSCIVSDDAKSFPVGNLLSSERSCSMTALLNKHP